MAEYYGVDGMSFVCCPDGPSAGCFECQRPCSRQGARDFALGPRVRRHLQRPASIGDQKRNRIIWKGRAKDASAYISPKGQCPPAETTLEVRA